jgi:mannose-6-phosphate isomerase-like protein (cupin superfamily)
MTMRYLLWLGIAAAAATGMPVSAQFLGKPDDPPRSAPSVEGGYWAPKPSKPTPYVAPNKVHWKLSAILAAHRGRTDWLQPLVRNAEQEADYISLGAGTKTKRQMYADDRVLWIVQDGAMKVSIDGFEPIVATKGFMVSVPYRNYYTIETIGDKPSLRFEVRRAGAKPLYPLSETPDPVEGKTYFKVARGTPGSARLENGNPIYVDFLKQVASDDKPYNGKFVWDDHFTSNILRGKAQPVAPDTSRGHFHVDFTEFWFIMEGKIGYLIEGYPYFETEAGDVVTAATGRWHRASNSPNAPMSTRIPLNPRPGILHNFENEQSRAGPSAAPQTGRP